MKKTIALVGASLCTLALASGPAVAATATAAKANTTDRAFVNDMTRHHQSAIEMAKVAQRRAEHSQIKRLANDIVRAQGAEIKLMSSLKRRLPGTSKSSMGMSEKEMGMSMDMGMLENAKPFDRMFIDMMISHHRGAIRMARIELAKGGDARTRTLARAVLTAQSKEIVQMNRWRKAWYGKTSPSGGVPKDNSMSGMPGM